MSEALRIWRHIKGSFISDSTSGRSSAVVEDLLAMDYVFSFFCVRFGFAS